MCSFEESSLAEAWDWAEKNFLSHSLSEVLVTLRRGWLCPWQGLCRDKHCTEKLRLHTIPGCWADTSTCPHICACSKSHLDECSYFQEWDVSLKLRKWRQCFPGSKSLSDQWKRELTWGAGNLCLEQGSCKESFSYSGELIELVWDTENTVVSQSLFWGYRMNELW